MSTGERSPLVGIIMGSDSDAKTMQPAEDALKQFDIPYECGVKSAHRTSESMAEYGRLAVSRGLQVIIAGAGGSAHLPGMIAAETRLPVVGVAIESSPDPLNAAFGSMLRMPKGTPLATIGKGEAGAFNAGLEAVRILALQDEALGDAYDQYIQNLRNEVLAKDALMGELGIAAYRERYM